MKVLLVEELPGRERMSHLFLVDALREAGHEAVLSNIWRREADYAALRPDVVVDNISDSLGHHVGKWSLNHRQRCVNLIWEQLPNPLGLARYRLDPRIANQFIDGRIAWGPNFKRILLAENPDIDPERVRVTGSLKHFTGLQYAGIRHEALFELYGTNLAKFDRIVLATDSFTQAHADPRQAHTDALKAQRRGARGGRTLPYVYEYVLWSRVAKPQFVGAVLGLARAHTDTLFILRLHPTKNPAYRASYSDLTQLPNVAVIDSGPIEPLIHLSSLVVSSRSGVLIDAATMGKPGINVEIEGFDLAPTRVLSGPLDDFGAPMRASEIGRLDLSDIIRRARAYSPPKEAVRDWLGPLDASVPQRFAAFLEDTMRQPALPRRIPPLALLGNPFARSSPVRRRLRAALKGLGVRATPKVRETFDYDRLKAILDGAQGE